MSNNLPTQEQLESALREVSNGSTVSRIVRVAGSVALTYAISSGMVAREPGRLVLTEAGADQLVWSMLDRKSATVLN
jgi:hypothetical protein